jgi:Transposase and inactivated derivatives
LVSYINLEEMMAERGVKVDHTTIMRWVHQYSPEIKKKGFHCKKSGFVTKPVKNFTIRKVNVHVQRLSAVNLI